MTSLFSPLYNLVVFFTFFGYGASVLPSFPLHISCLSSSAIGGISGLLHFLLLWCFCLLCIVSLSSLSLNMVPLSILVFSSLVTYIPCLSSSLFVLRCDCLNSFPFCIGRLSSSLSLCMLPLSSLPPSLPLLNLW